MRFSQVNLSALIFILVTAAAYCQPVTQYNDLTPSSFTVPSPEAYSLGRYGFLPLNKFTGTPSVSIPIHRIQFDELSIPIELSYAMNGLRPAEDASWVGLGWDLTANAVITRKINGGDDFNENLTYNGAKAGWAFMPDLGLCETCDPSMYVPTISETTKDDIRRAAYSCTMPDLEPDLFTANLFGKTLRFTVFSQPAYMGSTVGVQVLDELTHKVFFDSNSKTFMVIDALGYTYNFTIKQKSKNTNTACPGIQEMISSWFLETVTAPSGRVLKFNYRTGQEVIMSPLSISDNLKAVIAEGGLQPAPQVGQGVVNETQTITSAVYLTSIMTNTSLGVGEALSFTLTTRQDILKGTSPINGESLTENAKKLSSVIIMFDGYAKKTVNLFHSYFNESQTTNVEEYYRLKLDSVDINDQRYRFTYLNTNQLPGKTTKSVDYWGFYNGKANQKNYPSIIHFAPGGSWSYGSNFVVDKFKMNGADMRPDANFSKYGTLASIQYPTGGTTLLEYEANKAKVQLNAFHLLEGKDHTDETITNTYNGMYTQTIEHTFSLSSPITFAGNDGIESTHAMIDFVIAVGNRPPVALFRPNDPLVNTPAAELINLGTGAVVFSSIFKDYTDHCYPPCQMSDYNCYCLSSEKYFQGTLQPGNYKVKLYGNTALDTQLKIKIPLESITNPPTHVNREVGGLRIKKITDTSGGPNPASVRSFIYNDKSDPNYSSGILMNVPVYFQMRKYYVYPGWTIYGIVTSSPNTPVSYMAQGAHMGYSYVEEHFESPDTARNYKTGTSYSLSSPYAPIWLEPLYENYYCSGSGCYYDITQKYYGGEFSIVPFENGLVLSEELFDNLGNVVKATTNSYQLDSKNHIGGVKFLTYSINGYSPIQATQVYFRYLRRFLLTGTTTTDPTATGNQTQTVAYEYNNRWLPFTTTTTSSSGKALVKKDYYPFDYSVLTSLTNSNIVAKVVKSETTVNGNLVFGNVLEYNSSGLPTALYKFESANLVPPSTHSPTVIVPPNYNQKSSYSYFTGTINPSSVMPANSVYTSYAFGYNNRFPTAEITNSSSSDFYFTSFEGEEGGTPSSEAPTGRNTKLSGFTKVLNGLTTGMDYILTYWQKSGGNWTLQTSNIAGLSGTTYTISITGEVDEVRFYPKGSLMTTYTYNPLIGIESKTDPNNLTTKFKYDSFGRLILISDNDKNSVKQYQYHYKTGSN